MGVEAISGVDEQFPFGPDYLTIKVPETKAALGPAFPYVLNMAGQNFKSLVQLRSGGVRPVFEQGFLFWNGVAGDFLFGLGVGDGTLPRQPGVAVQNSDVVYQFDTNPALPPAESALNATIQRVTADPQGRRINGIANVTPTTGDLRIPMLTLHTLGDLFVPFLMEQVYAERVAEHKVSHLLVQRNDPGFWALRFHRDRTGLDLVGWNAAAGAGPSAPSCGTRHLAPGP